MHVLLFATAAAVAVVAAARSTWSPCGLSMLSTITPLGERGRGHRFAVSALWYLAGGMAGGCTLGALAAAGAWSLRGLPPAPAAAVGGVAAVAALASDLRVGGFALPGHRRQVNERWLDRYRSWVYGLGFGWQIGVGLATYLVTAAVYLTVVLAALTRAPAQAFAVGVLFGTARGAAVFLGSGITDTSRLVSFHRTFTGLGPRSAAVVHGAEAVAAAVLCGAAAGAVGGVGTGLLVASVAGLAGLGGVALRDRRGDPTPAVPVPPAVAAAASVRP
ncbi:MAG: hypothetical protein M0007_01835 [Actinomycetota bacterium]|nr:hypothetical protein [Actinomycetota bacterium]